MPVLLQDACAQADDGAMGAAGGVRPRCSFCGWARVSATPVMLSPSCERCSCRLDARVTEDAPVERSSATPPVVQLLQRALAGLLGALALFAAARLGYHAAGAAGAMIAFG